VLSQVKKGSNQVIVLQPGPHATTTRARMEGGVLKIVTITNVAVKEDILE